MKTLFWTFASVIALSCSESQGDTLVEDVVLIPGGPFVMGDSFSEGGTDELPRHTVSISAFYMDKYEVTKNLWDTVEAWAISRGYSFRNSGQGKAPDHPVYSISWFDAVKWCNARSRMNGLTPVYYADAGMNVVYQSGELTPFVKWSASGYRLPTEAEWEKAARGGLGGKRFPWGDIIGHAQANYFSDATFAYDISSTRAYHPTFEGGNFPYTSPVGFFAPNGYGLHDMAGNAFEWCFDWFDYGFYDTAGALQPDTRGPATGNTRVLRGGSWNDVAVLARCSDRSSAPPGTVQIEQGFRCVSLTPPAGYIIDALVIPSIPTGAALFNFHFRTRVDEHYLIMFKHAVTDTVWNWLEIVTGDDHVESFFEEVSSPLRFYGVQKFSGGFLSFPIKGLTPSVAKISAVMDHSNPDYCADGVVTAFTGESGRAELGPSGWFVVVDTGPCPTDKLYGFANAQEINERTKFVVNGRYTGDFFLFYDGHTGYDFPYDHANEVVAAAGGIIHKKSNSVNSIWIDHEYEGYSTWYLHMLPADTATLNENDRVVQGQHLGFCGNQGADGFHLHFAVKKALPGQPVENGVLVDPYGWSGTPGRDPSPVDGVPGHDNIILWRGP